MREELQGLEVERFCERLYPRLVGALGYQCGDRAVGEELAQETLARVWERWPSVAAAASPEAWAFRVGFNLANSWIRRRGAERRASQRLQVVRASAEDPDAGDAVAVRRAVAALPPRQRAALVLRYYADLGVDRTAEVLGCAPGTVKSLTHQGLAHLRAALDEEITDDA